MSSINVVYTGLRQSGNGGSALYRTLSHSLSQLETASHTAWPKSLLDQIWKCQERGLSSEKRGGYISLLLRVSSVLTNKPPESTPYMASVMSMSPKVIFILGSGKRIGAAIGEKFLKEGYKVAHASRTIEEGIRSDGTLGVRLDLGDASAIPSAFEVVRKHFGHPSVVVYNAWAGIFNNDPLAVSVDAFPNILAISITTAFAAAQELLRGRLGDSKATYIYTGNLLNETGSYLPRLMTLGIGKSGAANMLESIGAVYTPKNALFYYADERGEKGEALYEGIGGPAHADFFWELVQREKENPGPVIQTFVKDKGYVQFPRLS